MSNYQGGYILQNYPRHYGDRPFTPVDIHAVRTARNILSDRSRWTSGNLAVTDEGHRTAPDGPHASAWCAWGAMIYVFSKLQPDEFHMFGLPMRLQYTLNELAIQMFRLELMNVNDILGHEQTLEVFDAFLAQHAPRRLEAIVPPPVPVVEEERELCLV